MTCDLERDQLPAEWETDICIIGGGIAGLTLAHALRAFPGRVTLLEGGGPQLEDRAQELNRVELPEGRHRGATEGRFRLLGGSSTHWGAQLLPYEEEVFADRPWRGQRAWPIAPAEIYRFSAEVRQLMNLGGLPFTAELPAALGLAETQPKMPPGLRIRYSQWARFSARNLVRTLRPERASLTTFLHANAVALEEKGRQLDHVVCRSLAGRELRVRARFFVLALGTIEVSRLLLVSGLGPAGGQVGRGFHDHLSVAVGEVGGAGGAWPKYLAPYFHRGVLHTPKLEANPVATKENGWLDVMAHFEFATDGTTFAQVREALQLRQEGQPYAGALARLLGNPRGLLDLMRVGWHARFRRRRVLPRGGRLRLRIDVEQSATSRITLSHERDALGLPRVRLDWRITPEELETVRGFRSLLQAAWPAEWGPVQWYAEPENTADFADTYHMMGGTAMGADPATSVVDPDLRVHGTGNLFVASCSTFPNGGSSNPTFTLMCLCFRLAETLASSEPGGAS